MTVTIAPNPANAKTKSGKPLLPPRESRATQLWPRFDYLLPDEPCFLDIEFQKYKREDALKERHRIGRITILNTLGGAVLDVYASYPVEEGVKLKLGPPSIQEMFNVRWDDLLLQNGAVRAQKVEKWVAQIVKDRTVVVHGGTHDLTAFYYEEDIWATSNIVDTQSEYGYIEPRHHTPGLARCAAEVLGRSIQGDSHCPFEDADAMRELYLLRYPYDAEAEEAKYYSDLEAKEKAAAEAKAKAKATTKIASDKIPTKPFGTKGKGGQKPIWPKNGGARRKARRARRAVEEATGAER